MLSLRTSDPTHHCQGCRVRYIQHWQHYMLTGSFAALGFAGSAEVRAAGNGNLGLHDRACHPFPSRIDLHICPERLGLRWVQKYVRAFGGDPSKVTMYAHIFSDPFPFNLNLLRQLGRECGFNLCCNADDCEQGRQRGSIPWRIHAIRRSCELGYRHFGRG